MKWQGREESSNIEDRRGQGGGAVALAAAWGRTRSAAAAAASACRAAAPAAASAASASSSLFIVIAMAFGINPLSILTGDTGTSGPAISSSLPPQQRRPGRSWRSSSASWSRTPRTSGATTFQPAWRRPIRRPRWCCSTGRRNRAAARRTRRAGRSIAPTTEGLYRPRLLPAAARPVRRAGRFRAGLCRRARGRPPRAERCSASLPNFNQRRQSHEPGPGQRLFGEDRAAGRLLCRHVGQGRDGSRLSRGRRCRTRRSTPPTRSATTR